MLPPLLALLCLCVAPAAAQQPPAAEAPQITARADLVSVDVSITDAKGNFVAGLSREQFHVFDEGVEQPLTNFASIDMPVRILLLVETSPAVYLIHREHLEAAYLLLDGLAPADEVALAGYDDALHPLLPYSTDKARIAAAFGEVRYTLGNARLDLYVSLARALDQLAPMPGKRAIVLLSTGLDETAADADDGAKNNEWEKLAARLRSSGVVVYPVALGGELREPAHGGAAKLEPGSAAAQVRSGFERADRALREMAQLTGGIASFPHVASDFSRIYRQISSALRHEYSLGFVPPSSDGKVHHIEVKVFDARGRQLAPGTGRSAYQLQARPQYVAPAP